MAQVAVPTKGGGSLDVDLLRIIYPFVCGRHVFGP